MGQNTYVKKKKKKKKNENKKRQKIIKTHTNNWSDKDYLPIMKSIFEPQKCYVSDHTCVHIMAIVNLCIPTFHAAKEVKTSISLQIFFKTGVPKNFSNFTGKYLFWNLF